jgi:hypothetical protein
MEGTLTGVQTTALLSGAIFFMVSTGIAVEYCQNNAPFNSTHLYLIAEIGKFVISYYR